MFPAANGFGKLCRKPCEAHEGSNTNLTTQWSINNSNTYRSSTFRSFRSLRKRVSKLDTIANLTATECFTSLDITQNSQLCHAPAFI